MLANVFSVEIFFILFRETLEASVIISVILAFLKQGLGSDDGDRSLYNRMRLQVWIGAALGIGICLAIGGAFIGVFYSLGKNIWQNAEDLWEGIFSIIATVMITVMGVAMLRINKMREKWRVKIAQALVDSHANRKNMKWWKKLNPATWTKKYAIAVLPFITTLREGLEAVVFIGGVSLGTPATAFPLAVICGILAGSAIGYLIYRGGNVMSTQYFLIASTCFIYLIGAALFSRAIWFFEMYAFIRKVGGDVAEEGVGPGSYKSTSSVWHVNCCNPETDNSWMIFNALLGWQNSATFGSVISYNVYWLMVISVFLVLMFEEKYGHFPLLARYQKKIEKELSEEEKIKLFAEAEAIAQNYTKKGHKKTISAVTAATVDIGGTTAVDYVEDIGSNKMNSIRVEEESIGMDDLERDSYSRSSSGHPESPGSSSSVNKHEIQPADGVNQTRF